MAPTPPRLVSSLTSSASIVMRSLVGSRSSWPSSFSRWSSCMRAMRSFMVLKFVSRPPSQRSLTYGIPAASAASLTMSFACFLVPTNSTMPPRADEVLHERARPLQQVDRLAAGR